MTREALARITSDPSILAAVVEYTALRSGDPTAHDVMFVRVHPDRTETPAAAPDADLASYCTGRAALYDELSVLAEPPIDALFDIDEILSWLRWLDDQDEPVTTTYEGDPATGVTDRLVHETSDARVVTPCETAWSYDEVSLSFPERFDGSVFLDEDGEPMPTRVRTHIDQLERLVEASTLAGTDGEYAIVVDGDELRVEARRPDGLCVSAALDASVSGPPVRTVVGPEFERVVSGLLGPVTLQTGPDQPLALVQDDEAFTIRFVVH